MRRLDSDKLKIALRKKSQRDRKGTYYVAKDKVKHNTTYTNYVPYTNIKSEVKPTVASIMLGAMHSATMKVLGLFRPSTAGAEKATPKD